MDEEVEDIIGDVKYTDSQKSMTTSAVYSQDFTDSSSDKHNSSGKETYTITCDSDDSDKTFPLQNTESILNFMDATNINFRQENPIYSIDQAVCTSVQKCNIVAQEIFTQTSKTIMELALSEPSNKPTDTMETQTSFVSITENKTIEYTITETIPHDNDHNRVRDMFKNVIRNYQVINTDNSTPRKEIANISQDNDEEIIYFIEDDSKEKLHNKYDTDFDSSKYDSDIEGDSLEKVYQRKCNVDDNNIDVSETPNSIDSDVEDLYNKLSESPVLLSPIVSAGPARNLSILTPLTEETAHKKDSVEVSPSVLTLTQNNGETIFINNGVRVKMYPDNESGGGNKLKLPPISNHSIPNSPHLNYLFSLHSQNGCRLGYLNEGFNEHDRWELGAKELASGESPLITSRIDSLKSSNDLRLPPIRLEGYFCNTVTNTANILPTNPGKSSKQPTDIISINGKIKELTISTKKSRIPQYKSRSSSPNTTSSPEDSKLSEATERGCDALSCELLRRLRSSSWVEICETLEDLPKALDKFWSIISENRIADLLRRDFYEGISSLLTKTGSYNRAVRRAANVALDHVVSSVNITHSVTAICVYGVGHKNALVRSASARLLVVCCALAEGGRQILRSRPPTAAAARKHTLQSMAELLQDKTPETRKYAERLYAMLRPLQHFDAYFLTDVDVELATRHMKKYDPLLTNQHTS